MPSSFVVSRRSAIPRAQAHVFLAALALLLDREKPAGGTQRSVLSLYLASPGNGPLRPSRSRPATPQILC